MKPIMMPKSLINTAQPNKNKYYYRQYPNGVIETNKVTISYDKEKGNKIVNDFYFLENLGKGVFAKVKKCINLKTKEYFAVKIFCNYLLKKKKKSYGKTKQGTLKITYMMEDVNNELQIYRGLPKMHDNVIKIYQILTDDIKDKTYIIMELADFGSLITLDKNTPGLFHLNPNYNDKIYDEKLMKNWIFDIANGLSFLHENGIVHRDIKPDNIVIGKNEKLKIIDLGSAAKIENGKNDEFNKTEGNMYFYPPEFVDGKPHKIFGYKPVDMWAFGVTMHICIFKCLPFLPEVKENYVELFKMISECKINYKKNNIQISEGLENIFKSLFEKDPLKRITAKQLAENKFLSE